MGGEKVYFVNFFQKKLTKLYEMGLCDILGAECEKWE